MNLDPLRSRQQSRGAYSRQAVAGFVTCVQGHEARTNGESVRFFHCVCSCPRSHKCWKDPCKRALDATLWKMVARCNDPGDRLNLVQQEQLVQVLQKHRKAFAYIMAIYIYTMELSISCNLSQS